MLLFDQQDNKNPLYILLKIVNNKQTKELMVGQFCLREQKCIRNYNAKKLNSGGEIMTILWLMKEQLYQASLSRNVFGEVSSL
jgi:hypothetical protein